MLMVGSVIVVDGWRNGAEARGACRCTPRSGALGRSASPAVGITAVGITAGDVARDMPQMHEIAPKRRLFCFARAAIAFKQHREKKGSKVRALVAP